MLKRAITYETFDGNTVTEDFYFHISKADLAKMEISNIKDGGMQGALNRIVADKDGKAVIKEIDAIILGAIGRKSGDGKRFLKTPEIVQDFQSSPAYEVIFMELVTDAEKAAAFVAACIPGNFDPAELIEKGSAAIDKNVFDTPQPDSPGPETIVPERADPTATDDGGAKAAINRQPEAHPSDTAGEPAFPVDSEGRRILTEAEARDMSSAELAHLLGRNQAVIRSELAE